MAEKRRPTCNGKRQRRGIRTTASSRDHSAGIRPLGAGAAQPATRSRTSPAPPTSLPGVTTPPRRRGAPAPPGPRSPPPAQPQLPRSPALGTLHRSQRPPPPQPPEPRRRPPRRPPPQPRGAPRPSPARLPGAHSPLPSPGRDPAARKGRSPSSPAGERAGAPPPHARPRGGGRDAPLTWLGRRLPRSQPAEKGGRAGCKGEREPGGRGPGCREPPPFSAVAAAPAASFSQASFPTSDHHQTPSAGDKDSRERNEEKDKPEKEFRSGRP
ncbi:basic proline-rich protein-like [Talpa occidentalis]|uniref:basic proline-rich protein-like n=1 Tax=Talpa occidentalis TaxID=50954 RepID=UPI00188EC55F|nr:basic proline-rich protein-like [Talpa occidentalis]